MTIFDVLLILDPTTKDIELKVNQIMKPYYSYLEVQPYKIYLNQEDLEEEIKILKNTSKDKIAKQTQEWGLKTDELESLAKISLDWSEEEIDGVDQNGEYKIVNYNPQGKWDWYRFIEKEKLESGKCIFYPCKVRDIPHAIPYAIITPDNKWHELGEIEGLQAFITQLEGEVIAKRKQKKWQQKVQNIKTIYSNHLAVALRCHE
ncbi:MAG: hypothetical protein F6K45_21020 [Kamptonema sp. SIO1D9]|nr:hypothetical protein [Kamptonema sp. SIO1D9]